MIVKAKQLLERFTKKNCKRKKRKKEFRVKKVIHRKGDKLYVKWKGYDSWFNSWIDKKDIVQMSGYFPVPKSSRRRIKGELYLSNYATKAVLKKCSRC